MKAHEVLAKVNELINEGEQHKARWGWSKKWRIWDVCDDLGIFDWWNDYISVSQLKQMKRFLEVAIKLGYAGYVCFKVGAAGCAHGMWAHKLDSEDGFSPRVGGCLYHSFVGGANYWDLRKEDGMWMGSEEKYEFTLKEIKAAIAE